MGNNSDKKAQIKADFYFLTLLSFCKRALTAPLVRLSREQAACFIFFIIFLFTGESSFGGNLHNPNM
jgi:hypothetical protein